MDAFRPATLLAALLALLPACSFIVSGQTDCQSSADCSEGATCEQGLCVASSGSDGGADAGTADTGVADAGADAGTADAGADAGLPIVVALGVVGSATATAGTPVQVTVTALDSSQQAVVSYRGKVHFTATGATRAPPTLPGDYTYAAADRGVHAFNVTFKEAAAQVLTVTDTANSTIKGTLNVSVQAGVASKVTVSGIPASVIAGAASDVTVRLLDANDNPIKGFTGSVSFTSSDGAASLPPTYTFLASENGAHTFAAGVTLKTAGTQSVTAGVTGTGVNLSGSQPGIAVSAAAADHFSVSGIGTSIGVGTAQDVVVTAFDVFGNQATGYRGKVHFTSSDSSATLPADYTFAAADAGQHTFAGGVRFGKAGTFSVTATDVATASITGVEGNILVVPNPATQLAVSGIPAAYTAGSTASVTVRALDAGGNPATSYVDTVTLSSTDSAAVLPASYTFVAADNGSHTFAGLVLKTVGTQSVTAKDVGNRTGTQGGIVVSAAPATALRVSGITSPIAARATSDVVVAAVDGFGNTDKTYRGTVHFTSSDSTAVLPANTTFLAGDNGQRTFSASVSFKKAGAQSVTATDTVTASISGKQDPITVQPGAVAAVAFSQQPSDGVVGQTLAAVQVRLDDQDGNLATNSSAGVTLSLAPGFPSGATLSGTLTATPSSGIASFTDLSVNRIGTYALKAAVAGISATATSSSFTAACANGSKPSTVVPGTCVPVCSEASPCTSPPSNTCSGNTLTSYPSPGTCTPDAAAPYFQCAYPPATSDCTLTPGDICFVNACIPDPCAGGPCVNQAPDCADPVTRRTYLASCTPTGVGTHSCAQTPTPAACPGAELCAAGACGTATVPGSGDLVISEVMHAPSTGTVTRRWFEMTSRAAGILNLAGLTVDDGTGGNAFSLPAAPPVPLAAGGFFVVGEVPASYVNASMPTSFPFGASGRIRLREAAVVVDDLAWDGTFPQTVGDAMNLSAKFVAPLSNTRAFHWCNATTAIPTSGSDLGTPGAANIDCAQAGTAIIAPNHPVALCVSEPPATLSAVAATPSAPVLGQVSEPGATDVLLSGNDYYPFLEAQLGYGATGSDPSLWTTWSRAGWNTAYAPSTSSAYDEYTASLVVSLAGSYSYGFRFRLVNDAGAQGPWVYCDLNGKVAASPPVSASYPVVSVEPVVTSTTPTQPQVGASLVIRGAGFEAGTTVTIGGTPQTPVVVTSATRLDIATVNAATPTGSQPLIVTSNGQASASLTVNVQGP